MSMMIIKDLTFIDGDTSIKEIYFDVVKDEYIKVGTKGVTQMKVIMERGQMSEIPWVAVFKGDKIAHKLNLANVVGVGY